jgi:LysM repeat protein
MRRGHVLLGCLFAVASTFLLTSTALVAAQQVAVREYVVQPGDSLFRIAQRYSIDINTLAQANNITNTWQIYSGQRLVIPDPNAASAAAAPAPATTTHVVGAGESLTSIARVYGMTPEALAELNDIVNPNLVYRGQTLLVVDAGAAAAQTAAVPPAAEPAALPTAITLNAAVSVPSSVTTSSGATYHTVQPGEYLSNIAARYGVSWLEIAAANSIYNPDTVYAGQRLLIPGAGGAVVSTAPPGTQNWTYYDDPAAPAAVFSTGRSIIVDLSDQRIYAYENGALVRVVVVSTGLPATPTVTGTYNVYLRYTSQNMSGPGYYLPGVPYVMYFYQGYAIHGTYWHSNFGTPMSRGCVNLPTPEAEWFFNWADYGTPVTVQI